MEWSNVALLAVVLLFVGWFCETFIKRDKKEENEELIRIKNELLDAKLSIENWKGRYTECAEEVTFLRETYIEKEENKNEKRR